MKKILFSAILALFLSLTVNAQEAGAGKKVYNEEIDPIEQIDQAAGKEIRDLSGWGQLVPLVSALCRLHHERHHDQPCD